MTYAVEFTQGAEDDLVRLYDVLLSHAPSGSGPLHNQRFQTRHLLINFSSQTSQSGAGVGRTQGKGFS